MKSKQKSSENNNEAYSQDELENYKIAKSLNPEEEISNLFKHLIFKTNTEIIKHPKVRNKTF